MPKMRYQYVKDHCRAGLNEPDLVVIIPSQSFESSSSKAQEFSNFYSISSIVVAEIFPHHSQLFSLD